MIKLRHADYCNLKLFLLYLVVYGHWIEAWIESSEVCLWQYRIIYLIHMPLFAFLSGLFLRNQEDCVKQIRRLLPLYGLLQLIAVVFGGGQVSLLTPFWHLWYLLSYCFWAGFGCSGRSDHAVGQSNSRNLFVPCGVLWYYRKWCSFATFVLYFKQSAGFLFPDADSGQETSLQQSRS